MKYIFITGGVVSSLGKGLVSGTIGALLETRGLKVRLQKFDPYLNVDPGMMSPFQHGEVYVLDDGAETDLDLGHYERFTNCKLSRANSVSSGQVYESVLDNDRKGVYKGNTVQVIPHVTNEIKGHLKRASEQDYDVFITEIGGTIGDIEGLPFLEALRQFTLEVGKENVLFVHITLLPYLRAAGELKTKPSQQSVAKLREIGIQPDILICRTEQPMGLEMREKLSLFCNVEVKAVVEELDVRKSIYELPLMLSSEGLDQLIVDKLRMNAPKANMAVWENIARIIDYPKKHVKIAVVGKYIDLQDAYKSVYEGIAHGGLGNDCKVEIARIDSEKVEKEGAEKVIGSVDGILIPGGFGDRGVKGKIMAAEYARKNKIPYLGIALGMQIAMIEFARNVMGFKDANSSEFDPQTQHPIFLPQTQVRTRKGDSMRLGAFDCTIQDGSLAHKIYGKKSVSERHRHRYEFNDKFKADFEKAGVKFSGMNEKYNYAEIVELGKHPWMLSVQFHPEFLSKPMAPHPIFASFVEAAIKFSESK